MSDWLGGCLVAGQSQPTTNINDKNIIHADTGSEGVGVCGFIQIPKTDITAKESMQLILKVT